MSPHDAAVVRSSLRRRGTRSFDVEARPGEGRHGIDYRPLSWECCLLRLLFLAWSGMYASCLLPAGALDSRLRGNDGKGKRGRYPFVRGFVSDWSVLREHRHQCSKAYVEDCASKDRRKMT